MSTSRLKTERLHSLDTLRAIMMMLGIVLHASITYVGGDPSYGWPMRDPSADNGFLFWLLLFIHNFRMPIFMLIAGFFAALLFYERSPSKMLKNRFSRLVLPFCVFVVILWPLVTMGFSYSNAVFGFSEPFDSVIGRLFVGATPATFTDAASWVPGSTMHLWFVYYLIMFSVASFALGMLFRKFRAATETIKGIVRRVLDSPLRKVLFFPAGTFVLLLLMERAWVSTSTSFVPDAGTFFFYFYFYMSGWLIFKARDRLHTFMDHDWAFSLAGVVLFTALFHAEPLELSTPIQALINTVCVWLFVFGFTGLFIRYFSQHSAKMRYVSDSAYWVYLLHLPLTALIPGLISDWPIPAVVKFLVVVAGTAIVCFVSYHYLVRNSVIGLFLNGRRYSRKLSDIAAPSSPVSPGEAGGLKAGQ